MKRAITIFILLLLTGCRHFEDLSVTLEEASTSVSYEAKTETETEISTVTTSKEYQSTEAIVIELPSTEIQSSTEQTTNTLLYYGNHHNPLAEEINKKTIQEEKSEVVDIFETNWKQVDVRAMIEEYIIPDRPYLGGMQINEAMKQQLLDNRNLDSAFDNFSYCLFTDNADLRSFPTDLSLTGDEEPGCDKFQETVVYGCSAGVILHESMDGLWYFVQSENYAGWVKKDKLTIVSKELAKAYTELDSFVIISMPNIKATLDNGELVDLRFGQRIPVDNCGNLLFPCIESHTYLELSDNGMELCMNNTKAARDEICYVMTGNIPEGCYLDDYLELNQDNLEYIMNRMLGADYCWGDKGIYTYDCSSAVGAVYRCFGIILPRNTSPMKYSGGEMLDTSYLSPQEKSDLFNTLPIGTIVGMPGHVCMIYKADDGNAYFHCNTHTFDKAGNEQINFTTLISSFETYTSIGTLFSDEITYLIYFKNNYRE